MPQSFAEIDGVVFFAASDGDAGLELWRTDGTGEGTVLVQDIAPGPSSSSPVSVTAAGPLSFFVAGDGEHGPEIWAGPTSALAADPLGSIRRLADAVRSLDLRAGAERSLVASLDHAARILEDGNDANDHAATHSLEAFIHKTWAQRGKALSSDEADRLEETAGRIIDALL
jgi:ELWxxDGT repeat protein